MRSLLADTLVLVHLLWLLFMFSGLGANIWGILFNRKVLDWFWFRTIHLSGIIYVGTLSILGKLCPLTIWENALRSKSDPGQTYPGSFIIHYAEKLVYPEIDSAWLQVGTICLGIFTILLYIIAPPQKLQKMLKN